jgi:flagellar hook assembly protein FlgD
VFFAAGSRIIPSRQLPNGVPAGLTGTSDLIILSCKKGLKALLFPGNQSTVRITIARADGKIVKNDIVNTNAKTVRYEWNGKSSSRASLGNGIYIIRMQTAQAILSKKAFVNW